MWNINSYDDNENTGRRRAMGSSLIGLAVIGVLVIVFV